LVEPTANTATNKSSIALIRLIVLYMQFQFGFYK
jgi:hypothetical protein